MSTATATALVNWSELSKIILAALVGGTGVVIVFGLLLLAVSRGKTAATPDRRFALYAAGGLCAVVVAAVAAAGVYAMTQKSSSAKPKPKAVATAPAPVGAAPAGTT